MGKTGCLSLGGEFGWRNESSPRISPPVSSGAAAILTAASWFHLCFPGLSQQSMNRMSRERPCPDETQQKTLPSSRCIQRLGIEDEGLHSETNDGHGGHGMKDVSAHTEPGSQRQPRRRFASRQGAAESPDSRMLASSLGSSCMDAAKILPLQSQRQPGPNPDLAASKAPAFRAHSWQSSWKWTMLCQSGPWLEAPSASSASSG